MRIAYFFSFGIYLNQVSCSVNGKTSRPHAERTRAHFSMCVYVCAKERERERKSELKARGEHKKQQQLKWKSERKKGQMANYGDLISKSATIALVANFFFG